MKKHIENIIELFKKYRRLAEEAVSHVSDQDFFNGINQNSNSIAIIMKHLAGDMENNWLNFTNSTLESGRESVLDFEKADLDTKDSIIKAWEEGWESTLKSISNINSRDLYKVIPVGRESMTILEAINNQLAHYTYHIGQIILLAKHYAKVN